MDFVCAWIVRMHGSQLVPQLLMKQSYTFPTQYRHIEHLHEEFWCQKYITDKMTALLTLPLFPACF